MKKNIPLLLIPAIASWFLLNGGMPAEAVHNLLQSGENSLERSSSPCALAGERTSEIWMGVYMNGVKVGYSTSKEYDFMQEGKKHRRSLQESLLKVTRLGGNPVEIGTRQDSVYDAAGVPLETVLKTKMSASEIFIKAEIGPEKVVFKSGEKITKELLYEGPIYLDVPVRKIVEEGGLRPGNKLDFKMLEPLSQSLVDVAFEIFGKETVLILGVRRELWHVRTEMTELMPVVMDEWMDEKGEVWKSVTQASFLNTVSIRMPREKALEMGDENLDIAFSVLIPSNVRFAKPLEIRSITFQLSGIPVEKIARFPFDGTSLKLVEIRNEYAVVQTRSLVFSEKEAIDVPIVEEALGKFLKPTAFCQADDSALKNLAREIVGGETNSWAAAKKIARWVSTEMRPNYDVGFASAKEILENREGDCSEHTVIMVTLCRAVGIPARAAVGIMYGDGIFAYHMWPEVYVGRWVGLDPKWLAVDQKTGEYYTDATHLKLGESALDADIFIEMGRAISEVIGKLKLEILDYSESLPEPGIRGLSARSILKHFRFRD